MVGDGTIESFLEKQTEAELMRLRAALDAEMAHRGLSSSVGAFGERLVIQHFNQTRRLPNLIAAATGTKNVDALSRTGARYSIKTVQKAKKTGTIYQDIDDPSKQLFEFLLVGRLGPDWSLKSVHQFTWAQFLDIRSWDKRMNAWYISLSRRNLSIGECVYQSG